jgi:rubrerythrin
MIKKAKLVEYKITVEGTWICPNCKKEIKINYDASPYREIAEDPPDDICPHCYEFFTLNFYNDNEN